MTFYFKLQFQLFRRALLSQAISPRLVMLVVVLGFIPASNYFYDAFDSAKYVYAAFPIIGLLKFTASGRVQFINSLFSRKEFIIVRVSENGLISLPFILFLLVKADFTLALFLMASAVLLAFINFKSRMSIVIPTPFSNNPFEFLLGFRKVWMVFPMAYLLTIVGQLVNNSNLGIAAQMLVFGMCIFFYNNPEKPIYVWIYSKSNREFIHHKIKTGLIYSTFLTLPILLFLAFTSPSEIDLFLLFQLIGYAFLTAVIIAKYASFPDQVSIPHGIVIGICIWFPPLIIIVIPYLYRKAMTNLSSILND